MSDYVSRQAVIDYLMINMNWFDEDGRMVDDWSEKLPIITDLINGVPSVATDINVPDKWISVKDRKPEVDKSVLYCAFGRSVGEGVYRGFDGRHHVWNMYSVSGTHWDNEVTHWMPLPEPPKEVKQSD